MSKPEIGAGDVVINLEGHGEVTLRPTLDACRRLSGMEGGVNKMIERCRNLEFGAIHSVIAAGLGKDSKDLQDLIYRSGLLNLHGQCIDFLIIVANGGRRISGEEQEEKSDPLESSSL